LLSSIPQEYLFTDESMKEHGLSCRYTSMDSSQTLTRIDKTVDFVWGQSNPVANIFYDNFIAEWSGILVPPATGDYMLGGESHHELKIFINDSLLVSMSSTHEARKRYKAVQLLAGQPYKIRATYKNNTQYALARLLWEQPRTDIELQKEALQLASSADAVVLCMGLSPQLEGEEMKVQVDGFAGGDRISLGLPKVQADLIQAIHKLGKPTVLVLLNGSALACTWEDEHLPAIVEAWYPGQQGGVAIADILFGDYNPAGRLPVTFYRSAADLPPFDDYDMQGKTYRYFAGTPLYEFGHGLSYTTFEYNITAIPSSIKAGDSISLAVSVKNTGAVDGDEVVQLYVSLPQSKLKTPIRALQGFRRIHLKAGEQRELMFSIAPAQMSARDNNNVATVESGTVQISVGGRQPNANAIAAKQVAERNVEVE
jgi:beta-glucosidase